MQLLTAMSTRGKLLLGACALGFVVAALLIVKMASAPSYSQFATGLDPKTTGDMTTALDQAGVAYEIQSNGAVIAVQKSQFAQARIALAGKGLDAQKQQPGYELLDKQKLGTSNLQQQVALQRAMEGEIASTIDQIDGVNGASVALTMPKDDLFASETQPSTAAVMLGGGTTGLDAGAVRGIANLVASSVPGLKADKVTITDGTGVMLWPQADGAGGTGTSKAAAEQRYAQQLSAQLNTMLTQTLGPGHAQVQVHADLNVDQATEEKLTYAKKGVPLKATQETETLRGTGGGAGAGAGTATNIPSYAGGGGAGGGSSNYKKTTKSQDLGVDKTVTRRTIAPGQVNRLDVAVLVDQASKPNLKALQAAVSSAAGIQAPRGDTLTVQQLAFAKPATTAAAAGAVSAGVLGILKPVGLGLAVLLFGFFMTRHLRKRQAGAFADEPSWLRQLEAPRIAAAIGGGTADDDGVADKLDDFDPQAAARKVFANDPRAVALQDLIEREPEKVAHQLRSWITDERD